MFLGRHRAQVKFRTVTRKEAAGTAAPAHRLAWKDPRRPTAGCAPPLFTQTLSDPVHLQEGLLRGLPPSQSSETSAGAQDAGQPQHPLTSPPHWPHASGRLEQVWSKPDAQMSAQGRGCRGTAGCRQGRGKPDGGERWTEWEDPSLLLSQR